MFAAMTLMAAQQQLLFQLYHIYDDSEAAAIADMVMESLTGWKKIDRVMNKTMLFSKQQEADLSKYIDELLQHTPVQYVLQEAWFYGMKLYVNSNVLVPRPETEELVDWIVKDSKTIADNTGLKVLDMGTGSGCIALGIKNKLSTADVHGCDISEPALEVARKNSESLGLAVKWHRYDILNASSYFAATKFDIIVSNPPYIPMSESSTLSENVLHHEPHLALFATDDDPLQFYKAIVQFGRNQLSENGRIYFEVHYSYAQEVCALLTENGYTSVEIRKDMQGKERMVVGYFTERSR